MSKAYSNNSFSFRPADIYSAPLGEAELSEIHKYSSNLVHFYETEYIRRAPLLELKRLGASSELIFGFLCKMIDAEFNNKLMMLYGAKTFETLLNEAEASHKIETEMIKESGGFDDDEEYEFKSSLNSNEYKNPTINDYLKLLDSLPTLIDEFIKYHKEEFEFDDKKIARLMNQIEKYKGLISRIDSEQTFINCSAHFASSIYIMETILAHFKHESSPALTSATSTVLSCSSSARYRFKQECECIRKKIRSLEIDDESSKLMNANVLSTLDGYLKAPIETLIKELEAEFD